MKSTFYAAYNKDQIIHKKGSSGSIYYSIAKYVLDNEGIVCAAIYDDNFDVKHVIIDSVDTLYLSMGSKYVASQLNHSFNSVLKNLEKQKLVLFVGTPCQCAGLHSFINLKNKKYLENLIIVDIVCQGVPSQFVWQKYLDEKRKKSNISMINMRDKEKGWLDYCFTIEYTNGQIERIPRNSNEYLKGFVQCLFLRPSCYHCCFKGLNRSSDITLGDLWGCNYFSPENYEYNGTSLIWCHTNKGNLLLNSIKSNIVISAINDEKAVVKYNRCIIESVQIPKKRSDFFTMLNNGTSYSKALAIANHRSPFERIISIFKRNATKMVRKINRR